LITLKILRHIAKALGVTVVSFFDERTKRSP
jgi:hypothetical protein